MCLKFEIGVSINQLLIYQNDMRSEFANANILFLTHNTIFVAQHGPKEPIMCNESFESV